MRTLLVRGVARLEDCVPFCRRDTFAIGDVAEALEAAPVYPSVTRLCGVGHSFGGAALLAADIARVAHFDAVCGGCFPPAHLWL